MLPPKAAAGRAPPSDARSEEGMLRIGAPAAPGVQREMRYARIP